MRAWAAIALGASSIAAGAEPDLPAKLQRLAQPFFDADLAVGMVIGTLDAGGPRVSGFGKIHSGSAKTPDGDTVFEIGSITKVFTAIALQSMAAENLVDLDDPVRGLLPRTARVPTRGEREITLRHLASHVSGLPRLPDNLRPRRTDDPYADYTLERMLEFLSRHELARAPGETYEYSNLGSALLGNALALRARKPYAELVAARVCGPCGLKDTRLRLDDSGRKRLAPGHDADCSPTASWTFDAFAPAGGLRSTASDMLRFAAANLAPGKGAIGKVLAATHARQGEGSKSGLGWHLSGGVLVHDGGTGGYRSFLGVDVSNGTAVVVLANSVLEEVNAIGFAALEILRGRDPAPLKVRWPVKLAPADVEGALGAYELAPGLILGITAERGKLFVQLTGQNRLRLHAESRDKLFLRAVDAQISLERNAAGKVTAAVLHQGGRDQRGRRVK